MLKYLDAFYESVIDLSPDEMIGALVIGLGLAMACSGLCLLAHKKSPNPYPLLCGLIFVFCVSALAIGVGYTRIKYTAVARNGGRNNPNVHLGMGPFPGRPGGPHGGPPMAHRPGRPWLQEADADRNGQLTPEEAAQFVREADTTGKGSIDIAEFERSRRGHGGPPGPVAAPPGSVTPAPPPEPIIH